MKLMQQRKGFYSLFAETVKKTEVEIEDEEEHTCLESDGPPLVPAENFNRRSGHGLPRTSRIVPSPVPSCPPLPS